MWTEVDGWTDGRKSFRRGRDQSAEGTGRKGACYVDKTSKISTILVLSHFGNLAFMKIRNHKMELNLMATEKNK